VLWCFILTWNHGLTVPRVSLHLWHAQNMDYLNSM